jgi:GTP cyclohydrolase I
MRIRFKYFVTKAAPATGSASLLAYDCGFDIELDHPGSKSVLVEVPVSTVCPCSLEISDIGAHNQRAHVSLQVWQDLADTRFIWLEDLICIVENSGSADMHSVLKRLDEKVITERMFRTPRFVEDVVALCKARGRAFAWPRCPARGLPVALEGRRPWQLIGDLIRSAGAEPRSALPTLS